MMGLWNGKVSSINLLRFRSMRIFLLFACWVIFMLFLSSVDLFLDKLFLKNLFRNTIKVSNGLDPVLSVLIRVHTVCKGYQRTTKVGASKEKVGKNKSSPRC